MKNETRTDITKAIKLINRAESILNKRVYETDDMTEYGIKSTVSCLMIDAIQYLQLTLDREDKTVGYDKLL